MPVDEKPPAMPGDIYFGFAMLAILKDKETADRVKETMQY